MHAHAATVAPAVAATNTPHTPAAPVPPASVSATAAPPTFDPARLRGVLRELYDRGMICDITNPEAFMAFMDDTHSATATAANPAVATNAAAAANTVGTAGAASAATSRTVYAGFDPTAPSLHLGNMLVLMVLRRLQSWGHRPLAVVGGATGMVGDPSGRSAERNMMSSQQIDANIRGISKDIQKFLVFEQPTQQPATQTKDAAADASPAAASIPPHARSLLLNNASWIGSLRLLDFLRDVGRHFRMGPMLAKDSVSSRLKSAEGMSFTEFSYQTLQAYDFLHLHKQHGCSIQIGGSDQWGNITAGVELIQREAMMRHTQQQLQQQQAGSSSASAAPPAPFVPPQVFGLTLPLLTTSDGQKFGKSMGNAPIWLAAPPKEGEDAGAGAVTGASPASAASSTYSSSPYALYQHFLSRTSDADVVRFLRLFTDLSLERIDELEATHMRGPPEHRNAPALCKVLAEEVTRIVHGEDGLASAQRSTAALFGASGVDAMASLSLAEFREVFAGVPSLLRPRAEILSMSCIDVAVAVGAARTRAEARRLVTAGGMYLNGRKIGGLPEAEEKLQAADLQCGGHRAAVLRTGKKKQFVITCAD